jgi:acylphosphatase
MVALMTALLGWTSLARARDQRRQRCRPPCSPRWRGCTRSAAAPLAERARATLARLGYANVHLAIGDGARGWHEQAPFQGIIVAAAADEVPPELLGQLADGGRLVIPVGRGRGEQVLTIIERAGDAFVERYDTRCRFVPLIRDVGPAASAPRPSGLAARTRTRAAAARIPEESEVKSVDVKVSGMVQGVYYRAMARREGALRGLRGWVRNESDGSVALRLQGDPAAVDAMLDWCRVGPPAARVSRLTVTDAPADETLHDFEVR